MSAAENLKRWKESSRPRAWVEAHNGDWNHADWLALAEELKRSEYWPLELADVGGVLEELKSQWHDHQMQVEVLIEEAEAALEEGDLDQAVADCTEAMKLGPKGNKTAWLVRALLTRARAYLGKKDHDRAASDASEAARLDPGNREALTVRDDARRGWEGPREAGRADAVNSNKTKQLTTTISLAIDLACDSIISSRADALNVLCKASGILLSDAATPDEIQQAYGLAATKHFPANNPGDERAERRFRHVEAAWAFLQAEQVIAECTETLRAQSRNPLAFYQRAEAYFRTGDLDLAIADCTEALRLDRTLFCAYGVRGTARKRKGDHDKALVDLNEALAWNPAYALAFQGRGDAYRLLGKYDQAVADCDEAIRLDPRFSWAYATRGAALREKKEYDRALADLHQALRLNPIYGWAYAQRGEVYRLRGEHDLAIADFNEAIRLDPNHAWAFSRRGAAYWGKGDHDRAVVDCTEAVRLNPADSFAFAIRGDAYRLKRDKDQALKDFTEAIRLDPRNSWALSRRGEEYRARGDLKQALADLTEALRLNPDDVLAAHAKALVEEELQPPRQHQPKAQESVVRPCPGCQKPLRVAQENLGKQVKCPTCGQTFVAEGHERATGDERPASEAGTASPPRRKLPAHSVDQRPDCKDSEYTMTGPDSARCHNCGLTWKLLPSGKLAPADPKRCEFCGTVMTVEDFQIQDSPDLGWASVGVACKNCGADWHWARAGHWQTQSFPRRERAEDAADIAAAGSGAEPQAQEQQPPAQQPQRYTRECQQVNDTLVTGSGLSPGLLNRLKGLWRHRSVLGKVGLALGMVFLVLQVAEWVCVRLGIYKGEPGGNTLLGVWAFLKDIGVVAGLSAFCWDSLKTRFQEIVAGKPPFPDAPPTPEVAKARVAVSGIRFEAGEPGEFVGLNFQQWFVILSILFPTVLVVGVLTAFLSGGKSVWVTLPALAVIGILLAGMNVVALRRTNFTRVWGIVVGLSPLLLAVPSSLCLLPLGGMGKETGKWVLLVYGLMAFLPAYHHFQLVAPGTPPFRNSAGTWLALSYLSVVVILSATLPILTSRAAAVPEAARNRIIGRWVEADEPDAGGFEMPETGTTTAEFTPDGTALITFDGWQQEPANYAFVTPTSIEIEMGIGPNATVIILSDDAISLTYMSTTKRLVKPAKGGSSPTATRKPSSSGIDPKFVGTWELLVGGQKQGTMTITAGGRYVYSGLSAASFGGKTCNVSAEIRGGPKGTLILKDGYMVGDAGEIEFVSEDELVMANTEDSHIPSGTLRRGKD